MIDKVVFKTSLESAMTRAGRQTSRQSLDDLSRKEKGETLKRRGTNKKIDAEKAKSADESADDSHDDS